MTLAPHILHEDRAILVIDKPAGMPSVSLRDGESGTLAAWLLNRYPEQGALSDGRLEAGLVHRLDNETSGVILAARTAPAFEDLRGQFARGTVQKFYLALVLGALQAEGTIDVPIAHHPRKRNRMVACTSPEQALAWKARPASTAYRVLGRYALLGPAGSVSYTLLSVEIRSGVRHQIRVHLAHLGCPLAGDRLYQNAKKRSNDLLGLARQFLHSHELACDHPEDRKRVAFTAPLARDLQVALGRLQQLTVTGDPPIRTP